MLLMVCSLLKLTTSSVGFTCKAEDVNNRESSLTWQWYHYHLAFCRSPPRTSCSQTMELINEPTGSGLAAHYCQNEPNDSWIPCTAEVVFSWGEGSLESLHKKLGLRVQASKLSTAWAEKQAIAAESHIRKSIPKTLTTVHGWLGFPGSMSGCYVGVSALLTWICVRVSALPTCPGVTFNFSEQFPYNLKPS